MTEIKSLNSLMLFIKLSMSVSSAVFATKKNQILALAFVSAMDFLSINRQNSIMTLYRSGKMETSKFCIAIKSKFFTQELNTPKKTIIRTIIALSSATKKVFCTRSQG